MPYQATARCGRLFDQLLNESVLWQKVQLTFSADDMWFISE